MLQTSFFPFQVFSESTGMKSGVAVKGQEFPCPSPSKQQGIVCNCVVVAWRSCIFGLLP